MFCPNCGTENPGENQKCINCEYIFSAEDVTSSETSITLVESDKNDTVSTTSTKFLSKQIIAYVLWGVAAIVLILSFIAASNVVSGGIEISEIQSVGGKTLEEAYYQELGVIYKGYAGIIRVFGIFMASILSYFGFDSFNKDM